MWTCTSRRWPARRTSLLLVTKRKSDVFTILPEEQLLVNAMDLFSAGSETTATTLAWAVNYMVLHPEVQEKVQQEIDAVLGDSAPGLEDRARYTFLLA